MQTNAAVAEPMVEKNEKEMKHQQQIEFGLITVIQDQVYLRFLRLVQQLLRLPVLIFLVAYILVKGIPISTQFIQPGIYIRECFSDRIAIQHFYYDSFVAGNCSTTWDLCCDLQQ